MQNNLLLVSNDINENNFEKAYNLLKDITNKCETWYYLNSISSMKLGYYKEANDSIKKAIELNPKNEKYNKLLESFNFYRDDYYERSRNYRRRRRPDFDCCPCGDCCCCCCDDLCCCFGDDCCENIGKLWALDTCCECFGGDFVDCF